MSNPSKAESKVLNDDELRLSKLGYKQVLNRNESAVGPIAL